ncbi:hypothetical protein FB00_04270 [Cellulosimicrobium funkei]|uniref:N-acetyltransferase domain-containing protein n=1 Tax=Cellulosimicrobium funkei TaxID=264251 RepID=A0A0H2KRS0_9MICO|nr:GNAT family N-acetyltransferase [Cellulosimicrobium funkei]KLN36220.1 hypothetical protein FB00_04270 [Cellulosimicrobium funkei]
MTTITYRPYAPRDAHDVKAIIDEAFAIHRYVPAPQLLDGALEVYLRERLLASTYARVAVLDGRVVGVLMGGVSGRAPLPGVLGNRLRTAGHVLRLVVLGLPEWRSLRQYLAFDGVYRSLRRRTTAPLTEELTLFAVGAAARGLGAGKALYREFLAHLRQHGRTDFHLYTDSLCSYGFYEKHGMTRAAGQEMTVYLDREPATLGVYLYAGSVDRAAAATSGG